MSDTYEFLKAQKDAIVAKQDAELAEWLTAASEDIAHYRKQLAEAKAEIESLQAAQTEAVKLAEGVANLYTAANNLLVFVGREGSVSTDSGPINALSNAMFDLDGGTLLDDADFQTKDQKGKVMMTLEDLDCAKMMVRSAGYSLVSADFIAAFAEFIQDWRKGDFDLPKLAALDVKACFDAWQKEVNQNEVKPVLQAQERVPMTTADMVNVVKAAGWPADTNDRQLVAAFNLIEATETFHKIAKAE